MLEGTDLVTQLRVAIAVLGGGYLVFGLLVSAIQVGICSHCDHCKKKTLAAKHK